MKTLIFYKTVSNIEKEAKKIATILNADLQADTKTHYPTSFENATKKYNLVITVGGDGTVLHAELIYPGIPKLPLGAGNLEFLSSMSLDHWEKAIKHYQEKKYIVEERFKISCDKSPDALNEINISKKPLGQMFEGEVHIDNQFVFKIRGDGIIIATPTGSTAYALACGSDIIDPKIETISVVPVASFTLHTRPLVIPSTKKVKIISSKKCIAITDGIKIKDYPAKTEFNIRSAKTKAKLIRFPKQPNFYHKLQLLK